MRQGWIKICKVGRVKGRESKNMRWESKGMQQSRECNPARNEERGYADEATWLAHQSRQRGRR